MKNLVNVGEKQAHENKRWTKGLIIIIILGVVGIAGFYIKNNKDSKSKETTQEEAVLVKVKSLSELAKEATIEKIATMKPAVGAPLIARTGGRVTGINLNLGDTVRAGQLIISIDTGVEANPARAQLNTLQSSLAQLDNIVREALKAADNAVKTAQLSVDSAKSGRSLTQSQVEKRKQQASLALRQAELAYEDAKESEQRVDQVIRATDIGMQAARIAQDQANIAASLASQQTSSVLKQAAQGLTSAKLAQDRIKVDMQSQRISLSGQVSAAAEQVRYSQVISPVRGQITRLTVKKGDYIRPNQEVGEIIAFEGAQINVDVSTGVREKLSIGQEVTITARGQEFMGEILRLADGPRTDMALWQVDIFIEGTPTVVHPGDLVTVKVPVGVVEKGSLFIPLDVVVVRQDGIILMTVDKSGVISEHIVNPISYSGNYIEALVDIPSDAMVVTSGNRTLRAGDIVRFES